MYKKDIEALSSAAEGKLALLDKSPVGYVALSMLAGIFVALGGFIATTVTGLFNEAALPLGKLVAAFTFSSALSLVIMAGSELFTGNNLVMAAAALDKRVGWDRAAKLWLVCWIGNLAGSWFAAGLYLASGAMNGWTAAAFEASSAMKAAIPWWGMLVRGALCNLCVCLAVWCGLRMKSEAAKLIMVFWCILVFMVCGFEHSIANMSAMAIGLLRGAIPFGGYIKNIIFVSLGNMIGGVGLVAVPYWLAGRAPAEKG